MTYGQRNRKSVETTRRKYKLPGHPLAHADGQVYAYRIVLYDRIGPGEHACYWCGKPVIWGAERPNNLVVDHVDQDVQNDSPDNLVPSCEGCNSARRKRSQTHCAKGHEYTPENTYWRPDGAGRQCRKCNQDRERNRVRKR